MNYYEILEVSKNASKEVIKAAYKSLMQRYHPDRNPGNVEAAEHASRVVQAYDVLSDLDKRAEYDIELNQQASEQFNRSKGMNRDAQATHSASNRVVSKESKSYGGIWLIIILIILSGWLILSLTKRNQTVPPILIDVRTTKDVRNTTKDLLKVPEVSKDEVAEKENELTARVIPLYLEDLFVYLKPSDRQSDRFGSTLVIPVLGVKAGTFETEKVIRYIQSYKELIRQKLIERLAYAKYEELIKIDGEQYLKKIILDSINDTTGTNRNDEYPASIGESPGRYGIVDVTLAESFTIR